VDHPGPPGHRRIKARAGFDGWPWTWTQLITIREAEELIRVAGCARGALVRLS
jgi:hypothetical protein